MTACADALTWPQSVFLSTGMACFAAIIVVLIVLSARPR